MPQEFQIVRCHKCQLFQADQVKKATKWCCKICNEKQSIKKVYGRGSGRDCRMHIQDLNLQQGTSAESLKLESLHSLEDGETYPERDSVNESKLFPHTKNLPPLQSTSNWLKYLEPDEPPQLLTGDLTDQSVHNFICTDLENSSNCRYQRKRRSTNNAKDENKKLKLDNRKEAFTESQSKIVSPGAAISPEAAVEIDSHKDSDIVPVVLPSSKWFKYV